MARKLRVEFEGAVYHVMCRGDRRESIFEDDADRARFLATLSEACQRTGWRIHAYVLMSNHYHWLLETPRANLVAGMRWFQSSYTVRYNIRHRKAGHLFQGRYKAVLVEPEAAGYFTAVADYIHLNPARAGLLNRNGSLQTYRWSSLPAYAMPARQRPLWLEVSRVLGNLQWHDRARDRRAYVTRLEQLTTQRQDQDQLTAIRRGWVFGGDSFRERIIDLLENDRAPVTRKLRREETDRDHGRRQAERIITRALELLRVTDAELAARPKGDWRKRVIGHRVRRDTSVSLRWLADRLQMGTAGYVSRITSKIDDLRHRTELRSLLAALEQSAGKKD